MKRFLIPTDFSPVANQALTFAIHLAERLKAQLEVLHVFDHQLLETDLLPFHIDSALSEGDETLAAEQALLHVQTLMRKVGKEVPVTVRIEKGFPREQIVGACQQHPYDLIIMGTTGATNRFEHFFGSTTSAVMLEAGCPVLAIPPNTHFENLRKVAYATDFREQNTRTFYELNQLAHTLEAEIHCVHVETRSLSPTELAWEEENLLPPLEFNQIRFHIVRGQNVAEGLRQFIVNEEIDLLAVEPRHHHFPEILWNKSVTRHMVLHSKVPLLSIRSTIRSYE